LGTATALTAYTVAAIGLRKPHLLTPQTKTGLISVGLAAAGQFTLGVTTLLYYVPLSLAAAHQLGSIVVFTSATYLVHSVRFARPALVRAALAARNSAAATAQPASAVANAAKSLGKPTHSN
jgi:heme a synthase